MGTSLWATSPALMDPWPGCLVGAVEETDPMAARRTRLTGRGIGLLSALTLIAAGSIGVAMVRSLNPDCTVSYGDETVSLNQAEAENSARAVAAVVRRSGNATAAISAVRGQVDLDNAEAKAVANALRGTARASLWCRHGGADAAESDDLDSTGLTDRAATVRADLSSSFGDLSLGGFAPGGVSTGHIPGSAHYDGRAIDVFFRPINAANKRQGWAVAQYLVTQAERLSINTVIFDGRIWTARRGSAGWRDYQVDPGNRAAEVIRILEHRDHVHVDVAD